MDEFQISTSFIIPIIFGSWRAYIHKSSLLFERNIGWRRWAIKIKLFRFTARRFIPILTHSGTKYFAFWPDRTESRGSRGRIQRYVMMIQRTSRFHLEVLSTRCVLDKELFVAGFAIWIDEDRSHRQLTIRLLEKFETESSRCFTVSGYLAASLASLVTGAAAHHQSQDWQKKGAEEDDENHSWKASNSLIPQQLDNQLTGFSTRNGHHLDLKKKLTFRILFDYYMLYTLVTMR